MSEKTQQRQEGGKGGRGRGRGKGGGRKGGRGNTRGRGSGGRGGRANNAAEGESKAGGSKQQRNRKGGRGGESGTSNDDKPRRRRNNNKAETSKEGSATTTLSGSAPSNESRISQEEQDRRENEKALVEQKRLEEEKRLALELRLKKQSELEEKVREAKQALLCLVQSVTQHKENRVALQPESLQNCRKEFENNKKKLKTDLKKCTAFVKKIKSGGAWQMKPEEIRRDVSTLNLSRYVDEVVAALLEAKLKLVDLPIVVALCTDMHIRYPDFLSSLLPGLWSVINEKPNEETGKLRRLYVRLVTDFVLHGLLIDTKGLIKLIADATGGRDGSYAVTDANLVVAFGKAAGFEIFGTKPRSVQANISLIREANRNTKNNSDEDLVVLSQELAQESLEIVEQAEKALMERAVSAQISDILLTHCMGAYRTLCSSLVATHTKLQKLEKRCEQDRLLSGSLPESREKGLNDARKLMESLQKSVDAFSDVLDQPLPQLEEEQSEEAGAAGVGVELWTKGGGEESGDDFGPFDDEETRAFYCDIPDLLTTVPPGLLGMSQEEIEKRKAENLTKYGGGVEAVEEEEAETSDELATTEAQLEEEEEMDTYGSFVEDKEAGEAENKDTPHYRLMVLLEQELPECSRREQIDDVTEKFCTNHGSSKNSRKRLSKTLFLVPRTRLVLLPYYARMAAILDRVWPDIAPSLVSDLEQQFHGQAKFKKNQNIESRMKTSRYIGELTKFRVAPPIVSLRCLKRCIDDFTGSNVDVACCLLESCGRYLYRTKHTNARVTSLMDAMMRLSRATNLDERSQSLLKAAFYTAKPPPSGPKKQAKVYSPLETYLRHLLMVRLEPARSSVAFVSKQLIRFPWNDQSMMCGFLVCKIMLKTCRKGRYKAIQAIASVAASLRRHRPEVSIRLVDSVLEELRWAMDHPNFRDQQRTISYARLLGELYCASLVSGQLIIQQLYNFINYGHEIPETLREASARHESTHEDSGEAVAQEIQEQLPVFNSARGTVAQTIHEDEEMDEAELVAENSAEQRPVAVSRHAKFDPRVPSASDAPNSPYRIKLVCTLLEVVAKSIVTRNNLPQVKAFLAAFQRYLFTKTMLPTEVEFSMLDTFDIIDSQWRKATKDLASKGKRRDENELPEQGFPRFATWLEAHRAVVAEEENEAKVEARTRARIEALAGEASSEIIDTIEGDLLNEDDASFVEDEDVDSLEDPLSVSARDSITEDADEIASIDGDDDEDGVEDMEESQSFVSDDESDDSNESEDETDDDERTDDEDEFDEQAYMQQLEEEAFERELRRITMEALEKGKVAARGATGGKVADNMPSGSQIIKKKPADQKFGAIPSNSSAMALGGMQGISFQLLKKGNKGKVEAKEIIVPSDTNLAKLATKQDDTAARERDMIKARVLQYEAESAESRHMGGNVYLEQEKLQVIRNRPLSMEDIDRNFGTTGGNLRPETSNRPRTSPTTSGRSDAAFGGRGGRGGRGRGNTSGRSLFT